MFQSSVNYPDIKMLLYKFLHDAVGPEVTRAWGAATFVPAATYLISGVGVQACSHDIPTGRVDLAMDNTLATLSLDHYGVDLAAAGALATAFGGIISTRAPWAASRQIGRALAGP